jgi:hypothetical protein
MKARYPQRHPRRLEEARAQLHQTFGKRLGPIGHQQTRLISRHLARQVKPAPQPPDARMPPEHGGGRVCDRAPERIMRHQVRELVRQHCILLGRLESLAETQGQPHRGTNDAKCDRTRYAPRFNHLYPPSNPERACERLNSPREARLCQAAAAAPHQREQTMGHARSTSHKGDASRPYKAQAKHDQRV